MRIGVIGAGRIGGNAARLTNQFGPEGWEDLGGRTAAQVNAARMPGARYGEEVHEEEARAFVARLR